MLYWPSLVVFAAHAPTASKLEEHTQLVVRFNTHDPVAVPSRGGCSGGEGGDRGGGGGEGGEGGEGGGEGGEGGEGGGGGGGGDGEVKQTLKPPPWVLPSDSQLSAEASTPSGPSVPE